MWIVERCRIGRHGFEDRRKGSARNVPHRLSGEEEQRVYETATSPRFADMSPELIVAKLRREDLPRQRLHLLRIPPPNDKRLCTGRNPEDVGRKAGRDFRRWSEPSRSWDITWLKTDVEGLFLYAYTVIDLYDRSIVGWTIEKSEAEYARRLFSASFGISAYVRESSTPTTGTPCAASPWLFFLDSLMIARSYSRPRCSNDNAFHRVPG